MTKVEQYVEESQKACRDEDLLDDLWYKLTEEEQKEAARTIADRRKKPKS